MTELMTEPVSDERLKEIDIIYRNSKSGWSYDIRELVDEIYQLRERVADRELLAKQYRATGKQMEKEYKSEIGDLQEIIKGHEVAMREVVTNLKAAKPTMLHEAEWYLEIAVQILSTQLEKS